MALEVVALHTLLGRCHQLQVALQAGTHCPQIPVNKKCLSQTTWMYLSLFVTITGTAQGLSKPVPSTQRWQSCHNLWLLRTEGVCEAEPPQGS